MKRDFLKELGIDEEAIDKIMSENGKDIERAKSGKTDMETQLAEIKNQLAERDNQLEELKKSSKNSEDLEKKIQELQDLNKQNSETYEAKLKQLEVDKIIDLALVEVKAKNTKAVRSLLTLDNPEIVDGKIKGLDEQLKKLQESDSYLFNSEMKLKGMTPASVNTPNTSNGDEARNFGSNLASMTLKQLGIKK